MISQIKEQYLDCEKVKNLCNKFENRRFYKCNHKIKYLETNI